MYKRGTARALLRISAFICISTCIQLVEQSSSSLGYVVEAFPPYARYPTLWRERRLPLHQTRLQSEREVELHHDRVLQGLLKRAQLYHEDNNVELLDEQAAFCNSVYRITLCQQDSNDVNNSDTKTVMAKVFSPLALERMDPQRSPGELDAYVAEQQGLAPSILARNEDGILMQDVVQGRVLTEADIYGPFDGKAMNGDAYRQCAVALAHLHSLPAPPIQDKERQNLSPTDNMLWRACNVILSHISPDWKCSIPSIHKPSQLVFCNKQLLTDALTFHRDTISNANAMTVPIGHGDCKPSNAIALLTGGVVFIDLELTGRHFRAYDVAKFLRTSGSNKHNLSRESAMNIRQSFLRVYAATSGCDLKQLEKEVTMITPMTWLEAAIFFAAMEALDPSHAGKWNELAQDRLEQYNNSGKYSYSLG